MMVHGAQYSHVGHVHPCAHLLGPISRHRAAAEGEVCGGGTGFSGNCGCTAVATDGKWGVHSVQEFKAEVSTLSNHRPFL